MQALPKQLAPRYRNALPSKSTHTRISAYLEAMTPGRVLVSNFMASCEVLSADAVRSTKCRACRGIGSVEGDLNKISLWSEQLSKPDITWARARELRAKISKERDCRSCRGTGFRERNLKREEADQIFTTVRCGKCLGSGEIFFDEDREDECPRCHGDACVVPQTVRSTGSSRHGWLPPGATNVAGGDGHFEIIPTKSTHEAWMDPDQTETARAGWIAPDPTEAMDVIREHYAEEDAALRELEETDITAARAVALYRSLEGDQWAKHPWGRTFVLWPMTVGGAWLAERYTRRPELKGAGHLVLPLNRIAVEREQEMRSSSPDMVCRAMITKADAEARILEKRLLGAVADAEARLA